MIKFKRNHLKLPELFFGDLLILAKLLVLRLVDEDDPVSLQERLGQQTLREGRKSGLDHRQVDAVDGDVVARRALAGRLSSAVDGDGARDVADRNIVAVFLNFNLLFRGKNGNKLENGAVVEAQQQRAHLLTQR